MFCVECGVKLPAVAAFCPRCGKKVVRESTAGEAFSASPTPRSTAVHENATACHIAPLSHDAAVPQAATAPLALAASQVLEVAPVLEKPQLVVAPSGSSESDSVHGKSGPASSPNFCPTCRVFYPSSVAGCECGYNFKTGQMGPIPELSQGSEDPNGLSHLPVFPVATHKFIVLSLCTLGIYELYWSYQNWVRLKQMSGDNLSPFWRTFFAPLFGFSLFGQIRKTAGAEQIPVAWSAAALGTFYLLLSMSWRLPDPWWLISLGSVVPMIPVQLTAQAIIRRRLASCDEPPNDNYSGANVATIVVGGLLLVLTVVGAFLPS